MRVQVWSDVSCPWCFLGKRRLESALARWESDGGRPVEVVYRPFQLFPDASRETRRLTEEERREYGVHSAEQVTGYLAEVAAGSGTDFTWRPTWKPNTFDAHRLLAAAVDEGGWRLQFALKEVLLRAHFMAGEDISRHEVLIAAADEVGLSVAESVLAAGRYVGVVQTGLNEGALSGVRVVPTFVVDNHALAGAQPVTALLTLLRSAADRGSAGDADGDSPVRAYRLAQALLDAKDPVGALRVLQPVLADYGEESSVRLLAARAYFRSGQLRRARTVLEQLVESEPSDDYARFLLGRTFERESDLDQALRHFRVAMALSPSPDYADAVARTNARLTS